MKTKKMNYKDVSLTTVRALRERTVPYRPSFRRMLGNANAAILLSQINFWWDNKGEKRFYKFSAPCKHDLYREGDSWQEELGFSKDELNTALKHVATKITSKDNADEYRKIYIKDESGNLVLAPPNRIVIYWKTQDNVTWYELNDELLSLYLIKSHSSSKSEVEFGIPEFGKVEFPNSAFPNSNLYIDEQSIDEQKKKRSANFSEISISSSGERTTRSENSDLSAAQISVPEPDTAPPKIETFPTPEMKVNSSLPVKGKTAGQLANMIRKVTGMISKDQKEKLLQPVKVNTKILQKGVWGAAGGTFGSPEDLYAAEPLFEQFAVAVVNALKKEYLALPKEKRPGKFAYAGKMVRKIISYEAKGGWLEYLRQHDNDDIGYVEGTEL